MPLSEPHALWPGKQRSRGLARGGHQLTTVTGQALLASETIKTRLVPHDHPPSVTYGGPEAQAAQNKGDPGHDSSLAGQPQTSEEPADPRQQPSQPSARHGQARQPASLCKVEGALFEVRETARE